MTPDFKLAALALGAVKVAAIEMPTGPSGEPPMYGRSPDYPPPIPMEQRRPVNRAMLKQLLLNAGISGLGLLTGTLASGLVRKGLQKWAPTAPQRARELAGLAAGSLGGGIAMLTAAGLAKQRALEDVAGKQYEESLRAAQ